MYVRCHELARGEGRLLVPSSVASPRERIFCHDEVHCSKRHMMNGTGLFSVVTTWALARILQLSEFINNAYCVSEIWSLRHYVSSLDVGGLAQYKKLLCVSGFERKQQMRTGEGELICGLFELPLPGNVNTIQKMIIQILLVDYYSWGLHREKCSRNINWAVANWKIVKRSPKTSKPK